MIRKLVDFALQNRFLVFAGAVLLFIWGGISDSQRPFAIVIVGGLMCALFMSIFLLPTLYVWIAGENDVLPQREAEFEEHM